jgi:hypothetical protein
MGARQKEELMEPNLMDDLMATATERPCTLCTEYMPVELLNRHGECEECVWAAENRHADGA